MRKPRPVAMTIAGSDSGGGAGIEADLKTFAALGVHGTVALTSVTAQNTFSVKAVYDLPPEAVVGQIEAVHEDMGIDAAKTGMLSNEAIVTAVARTVRRLGFPLVVDPVMVAKSGAPLLRPEALDALKRELLPVATVVTPNVLEAEVLLGRRIASLEDMKEATVDIAATYGPEAVVVKGGHIPGEEVVDVLYHRGEVKLFRAPRVDTYNDHGSGCTFSAAIAAELARGKGVEEAVELAKRFVTTALAYSLPLGKGRGPVNPVAHLEVDAERWRVVENLSRALIVLKRNERLVSTLVPEVGMNIAMALPYPYARSPEDVAAVPGRISAYRGRLVIPRGPAFGASRHVAAVILTAMELDPRYRAAINVAYLSGVEEALERMGLRVSSFDRKEEPPEVRAVEGMTTRWGVRRATEKLGGLVPDAIIDYGWFGKEPVVFLLSPTATEVAERVVRLARELASRTG